MKLKPKSTTYTADPDMTPMIDMTFQLIAFFMVLLNFGESEVDARIKLPSSQLAKPPEAIMEYPLVVQLTADDQVVFGGETMPIGGLSQPLKNEARYLKLNGKEPTDATVIIRADAEAFSLPHVRAGISWRSRRPQLASWSRARTSGRRRDSLGYRISAGRCNPRARAGTCP
jgi:biopolymer transport protein ExbD